MHFKIFAELQTPVGMRDRQRALDVVGHRLAGGIGNVVRRQNHNVIAHVHPTVFTPLPMEGDVGVYESHVRCPYQRFVLQLWV